MIDPAAPPLEGYFFEHFRLGRRFRHATPRTVSTGDAALYLALTGARQPLACNAPLAAAFGFAEMPLDDALVFNIAFGKTVPDISANAVANLGYADVRFCQPVFAGDTIRAQTEVIGVRETSSGESGVVHVHSEALNQHGKVVLSWNRWVLVKKRDKSAPSPEPVVPDHPPRVAPADISVPYAKVDVAALSDATGSQRFWEHFQVGQRIDHPAGMTLDEPDHTFATRLYQNTAKVHFDALAMKDTPHGRRLVYGGHVISVCRALSYDGLENVLGVAAINGGTHAAPTFASDTLYAMSQVLDRWEVPGRTDLGLLRLRLLGLKGQPPAGFAPEIEVNGKQRLAPQVVLDLDYTVFIPRTDAAI